MSQATRRVGLIAAIAVASACRGDSTDPADYVGQCVFLPRPPVRDRISFERVFPKISVKQGVALVAAPGGSRWYVVTQPGVIYTFLDNPNANDLRVVADLTDQVVVDGEAGLLGMAFHPNFASNGEVFVSYTGTGSQPFESRVSRFRSNDGGVTLDLASEEILLRVPQPYSNHNGGDLVFGADGYLYFGLGDGGSANDPQGYAQNPDSLLGKILRIDVDSATPYAIPSDNPFADGIGARPEIFALGLRNPWRLSVDRNTGELWTGDVGQNVWEEVNLVERGGNYGWNIQEGPDCFGQDTCNTNNLSPPVAAYRNTGIASVIAGHVYRGSEIPEAEGLLLYTDFYGTTLWGVKPGSEPVVLSENGVRGISSFAENTVGEQFALDYRNGGIYRLLPATPDTGLRLPTQLSQTGCITATNPLQPPPDAIPYVLNVPFWSDNADKTRWLFLPNDQRANVRDDGRWDLPVGSVVVKTFHFGDTLIETRLLIRHDQDTWAGYTYAWAADGSDATLVEDAMDVPLGPDLGEQTWHFPGRDDCMFCHTSAAGFALGFETAQLARTIQDDAGMVVDQLDALVERGVIASRPAGAALPEVDGTAPLADRARAYLHSNCSQCHQPDAPGGRARIDLRFDAPPADVAMCDQPPRAGDLGLADARLLVPGDPSRSVISARMHSLGSTRMPAVASSVVDAAGTALIDAWISAIVSCDE